LIDVRRFRIETAMGIKVCPGVFYNFLKGKRVRRCNYYYCCSYCPHRNSPCQKCSGAEKNSCSHSLSPIKAWKAYKASFIQTYVRLVTYEILSHLVERERLEENREEG